MSKEKIIEAIDYALNNKWEESHEIVQDLESIHAYWVHAVLHKIEKDAFNSKYWYSKAKRKYSDLDPKLELEEIKKDVQLI